MFDANTSLNPWCAAFCPMPQSSDLLGRSLALNIISLRDCLGHLDKSSWDSGCLGSRGEDMFPTLRNWHMVFQSGCNVLQTPLCWSEAFVPAMNTEDRLKETYLARGFRGFSLITSWLCFWDESMAEQSSSPYDDNQGRCGRGRWWQAGKHAGIFTATHFFQSSPF